MEEIVMLEDSQASSVRISSKKAGGNGQASGRYAKQDDMSFEETNDHVNTPPNMYTQAENSQIERATLAQAKRGKRKCKTSAESVAIQELTSTIKEAFLMIKSSRSLSFARELFAECLKLKEYGYSKRDIGKAYDYLMADDARARSFFGKNEEFRKIWAEDFFESLHNQGKSSQGFN